MQAKARARAPAQQAGRACRRGDRGRESVFPSWGRCTLSPGSRTLTGGHRNAGILLFLVVQIHCEQNRGTGQRVTGSAPPPVLGGGDPEPLGRALVLAPP